MTRKIVFALVAALLILVTSCKCAAEKNSVTQIKSSHAIVTKKLMELVRADAFAKVAAKTMTQAEADAFITDWQKMVESDLRNIQALEKALGD